MNIKKARTLLIRLTVLTFLGILGIYFLINWSMTALVHSKKEVMVPDLKGKSLDTSLSLLAQLNLGLKKEGDEVDETLPAGTIIRQSPTAGMSVREGRIIKVVVSKGGSTLSVPDLTAQTVRAAEIMIRSAELTVGEESPRFSVVVPKGKVISQDPKPGDPADKFDVVNFVYSDGEPPAGIRLMPDWKGKDIESARRWAEGNALDIDIEEDLLSTQDKGTVVAQDPAPDADLAGTGSVRFTVSSGEGAGGPSSSRGNVFHYEIPQGGSAREVRILLTDDRGEREIFSETRAPGSKVEVPVDPKGRATVKVFINGVQVEERTIQ